MEDNIAKEPVASYSSKHYTYADYLNFGYDEVVEIIKGKIFRMSPAPSSMHQIISGNIYYKIRKELKNKKCRVFSAPFDVILPVVGKDFQESDRVVQPDVCVICDPDKIKKCGCFGAPDWIVEILSPHTAKKDLQDKFALYEESGVNEYWIIEPKNHTVEVFVLRDNNYARINTYVEDDIILCNTLEGMIIDLKEVFE